MGTIGKGDKSKDRFGNRSVGTKNHRPSPPLRKERERERDKEIRSVFAGRKMDRSQYRGPRFDRKSWLVSPVSGTPRVARNGTTTPGRD